MFFYWGIWLTFLLLSVSFEYNRIRKSYYQLFWLFILIAILVGGREYVGSDWESYKNYYETGIAFDKSSGHMEFFFELIRNTCFAMHFSYGLFCFIICLISLLTLWKALRLMAVQNCFLAFIVYLSLFFCNYQLNIIRHGLLASFLIMGMAYLANGKKKEGFLCVLASSGFHMIGLVFLPLIFLMDYKISNKAYIITICILFAIYIADLSGKIIAIFPFLSMIDRINGYVDTDRSEAYSLSVGIIGFLVITTYSILIRKKDYEDITAFRISANMLLMGFVVFCTLNAFSIMVQRIGNLFNLGTVFLLPYIWQVYRKKKNRVVVHCLIIIYLFLYYPKTWNVQSADGHYSMLPFKFDISNLF